MDYVMRYDIYHKNMKKGFYLSQFAPNALFLYPLKNLRFSNVFGGRERMYWE